MRNLNISLEALQALLRSNQNICILSVFSKLWRKSIMYKQINSLILYFWTKSGYKETK